jgi:hypothetical protein
MPPPSAKHTILLYAALFVCLLFLYCSTFQDVWPGSLLAGVKAVLALALCALLYAWLRPTTPRELGIRREQAKAFLDLRPRSYGERTHVGGNDILYAQLYPSRASGVQIRDAVCGRPVGSFAPITTLHDVPDEPRWRLAPPLLRRLLSPFADYDAPTYGERGQRFGSSASKLGLY